MNIRARIQISAIVATAIVMLAAPATSFAGPALPKGGGSCAVHVDSVEPLGLNVLGVVCI